MKPVALTETAAVASPELIPHEWDDSGRVLSPDLVTVDFGKKAGDRAAQFVLGLRADGTWRVGLHLKTKTKAIDEPCQASGHDYVSRAAALRVALGRASNYFGGDKPAVQTLSAFFAKTLGASAADECLTANAPTATSAPLPEAVPMELPVASIQRNPEQPRKDFPADAEQELADSIASVGLLQRIVVRRLLPDELGTLPGMDAPDRYELIAGERRWRAHVRLERPTIKAEVFTGLTRAQAAAPGLVENLQREGLNPIEEAEGYRDLMVKEGLTQEQCAQRVGMSRSVVANALRVLELPEAVLAFIRAGKLTTAHGVALARFKAWPKHAAVMAETATAEGWASSALEKCVPALSELIRAGLAVRIQHWDFDHELPAVLKKGPAIFSDGHYCSACFDVELYKRLLKERAAEKKAAADAAAEKARKQAEAAAKNPAKLKSLNDLPQNSYARVTSEAAPLLALVSDESVLQLDDPNSDDGKKTTICTEPELFNKVAAAVAKLKADDRNDKLPKLLVRALAEIHKIKKLTAHELTLLSYLSSSVDEYSQPGFYKRSLEACDVKVPKKALHPHVDGKILFTSEALAALRDCADPVAHYRVLVDSWLRTLEDDALERAWDIAPDSDLAVLLRWLLKTTDLGLLEETKAGQKQLIETVRNQDWYKKDMMAGEIAAAKAKPATPVAGKATKGKAAK